MTFSDIKAVDLSAIMGMGETTTLIAYNGASFNAVVNFTTETERQTGLIISDAVMVVKKSDVARPSTRDNAVINGDSYRIGQILEEDDLTWTIEANKMSIYP